MEEKKLHDPPFSVLVEPGKWYWGAVFLNCERPMVIEPAEITSAVPYPDQVGVFPTRCIHCSHVGHYPGNSVRSFRGG